MCVMTNIDEHGFTYICINIMYFQYRGKSYLSCSSASLSLCILVWSSNTQSMRSSMSLSSIVSLSFKSSSTASSAKSECDAVLWGKFEQLVHPHPTEHACFLFLQLHLAVEHPVAHLQPCFTSVALKISFFKCTNNFLLRCHHTTSHRFDTAVSYAALLNCFFFHPPRGVLWVLREMGYIASTRLTHQSIWRNPQRTHQISFFLEVFPLLRSRRVTVLDSTQSTLAVFFLKTQWTFDELSSACLLSWIIIISIIMHNYNSIKPLPICQSLVLLTCIETAAQRQRVMYAE